MFHPFGPIPVTRNVRQVRDATSDMRGWLLDCFPDDEEQIRLLNAAGVAAAVQRHYDGGLEGFLDAGDWFVQ